MLIYFISICEGLCEFSANTSFVMLTHVLEKCSRGVDCRGSRGCRVVTRSTNDRYSLESSRLTLLLWRQLLQMTINTLPGEPTFQHFCVFAESASSFSCSCSGDFFVPHRDDEVGQFVCCIVKDAVNPVCISLPETPTVAHMSLSCTFRGEKAGNVVESFLKEHNVESNTAEAVLKIVTTMGIYSTYFLLSIFLIFSPVR